MTSDEAILSTMGLSKHFSGVKVSLLTVIDST